MCLVAAGSVTDTSASATTDEAGSAVRLWGTEAASECLVAAGSAACALNSATTDKAGP